MYELQQVGKNTYVINSPTKVGLYVDQDEKVWLVDSGNDKDAAKKILKIIQGNHWQLTTIVNTHSHADHIGGNQYLQEQTGCLIYAPSRECAFIEDPFYEPYFLFGGQPVPKLQNKFLMAKPSRVTRLTEALLPEGFQIIPLAGHSLDMIGIITPDHVAFIADALLGQAILDKYHVGFLTNVRDHLLTLETLKTLQAKVFIPAHGDVWYSIDEPITYNLIKVMEVKAAIVVICQSPMTFEDILQRLFQRYDLTMNLDQYVLVGSTLKAYLTYLVEEGHMQIDCEDNQLIWQMKA
jgi:glyoxylase-like metal-dependent hydrolase (beta-lactamase superfamily II)